MIFNGSTFQLSLLKKILMFFSPAAIGTPSLCQVINGLGNPWASQGRTVPWFNSTCTSSAIGRISGGSRIMKRETLFYKWPATVYSIIIHLVFLHDAWPQVHQNLPCTVREICLWATPAGFRAEHVYLPAWLGKAAVISNTPASIWRERILYNPLGSLYQYNNF